MKKMTRTDLITSQEWSIGHIQQDLFGLIDDYMQENNLTRTDLANKLGVTKGYITQVLNGDFDHKLSKLVELALACGAVPILRFVHLKEYVENDEKDMEYELVPTNRIKSYEKNKASRDKNAEPRTRTNSKKKKRKAA